MAAIPRLHAWLAALPGMLFAVTLCLAATRLGAGVTPDTGHYLAVAQNLLDGRGYVRLGPEIMASWPPVYPTVLAAGQLVGLDPLVWARALNVVLFACCVALVVFWVADRTASRTAAAVAGLLTGLAPPLVYVSSLALTELPFITAVLASLRALDAWVGMPTRRNLLLCGAAGALACMIRYQGLAVVGAVGLVMLVLGPDPFRRRLKLAVVAALATALPLAAWLVRNAWLTGEPLGPRFASEYAVGAATVDLGRNAMSWFVPWRVLLMHPYAGVVLLTLIGLGVVVLTWRHPRAFRPVLVCVTFVGGFAIMMIAAVTRTAMDPLADRILSPMYAPLVVAAVIAASVVLRHGIQGPTLRRATAAVLAALASGVLLTRTLPDTIQSWREGPGGAAHTNFNTEEWRSSPTLLWARDNVRGLAFASSPAALFLVGRVDARPMPRKHARRSPSVPMDRLADIHRDVATAGSAYLVVSRASVPSHTFSLEELRQVFRLDLAARFPDGEVYRMAAKDVDPSLYDLQPGKSR